MAKRLTPSSRVPPAAESGSAPSPNRRLENIPPDNVPTFYINAVSFELSNWDVKMRLGQIHSGDSTVLNIAETLRVYMSHSHFRAFAKSLTEIIEKMDLTEQGKTS